jgi:hypothetical protein
MKPRLTKNVINGLTHIANAVEAGDLLDKNGDLGHEEIALDVHRALHWIFAMARHRAALGGDANGQ